LGDKNAVLSMFLSWPWPELELIMIFLVQWILQIRSLGTRLRRVVTLTKIRLSCWSCWIRFGWQILGVCRQILRPASLLLSVPFRLRKSLNWNLVEEVESRHLSFSPEMQSR
jgi:hypothetical protein